MNTDQYFSDLLQSDPIGKPDKNIENRLMYTFMVRSGRSMIRQNSFSNFFGWLFSVQNISFKAGLVSFILMISIINSNIGTDTGRVTGCDSVTTRRVLVADSTYIDSTRSAASPDFFNNK